MRVLDVLEHQRAALGTQRVARAGVPELGHRADLARHGGVDVLKLLALRRGEVGEPLVRVGARVDGVVVRLQGAGENLEEVDPAREVVGNGLEDQGGKRLVGIRIGEHALAVLVMVNQLRMIGRGGQEIDAGVHHAVGADAVPG